VKLAFLLKWRMWMLYLVLGAVGFAAVDRDTAVLNYINNLKGVEVDLEKFAQRKEEFKTSALREGVRYYKELLRISPFSAYAHANLGFCYFYLGDYQKAMKAYLRAVEIQPNLYSFHCDLGMICLEKKEFKQAVGFFGDCLTLIPRAERSYLNLVKTLNERGIKEGARIFAQFALRARSDREQAYAGLVSSYFNLKDYAAMRRVAFEGEKLYPQNPIFRATNLSLAQGLKARAKATLHFNYFLTDKVAYE